jgi:hypothetical protein
MPGVDNPTEKPGDEVDPGSDAEGHDADGDGADGEGDDADNAKTKEELDKEAKEAEKAEQEGEGEEADGEGEDADGEGQGKKGKKPGKKPGGDQAGKGDGKKLGDLAKQDWADYPKRIQELGSEIYAVRRVFKQIQERQLQKKITQSRTLEMLPQDGEVKDRFNMEAHKQFILKKLSGNLEESDLKRFHANENKYTPTQVDIVIMIDGSGSMGSARYNMDAPTTPLESALQASAILFEAANGKDMHMNVYVGMWGSDKPPIMIKPGDDRVKIGQAMEAMRKGLNSGTEFAPAVAKVAETIAEQHGKSGTLTGFTHVLVLSDGDAFDIPASKEKVEKMFQASDKVTFDVGIITAQKGTKMEQMADSLSGRKAFQEVGIVLSKDANKVPMDIVNLLLDKVRKCGSFTAIPNAKKRRQMKVALNKMGQKQ